MRIDAPPRKPAMNGLLAIPTSEALVRTPKPAPCAPGGITDPSGAVAGGHRQADAEPEQHRGGGHQPEVAGDPEESGAQPRGRGTGGDHASARTPSQQPAAEMMAERAGERHDRKQHARHERDAGVGHANLLDVPRQDRTEAAIDELQAEDHAHHQDEVAERQHVSGR